MFMLFYIYYNNDNPKVVTMKNSFKKYLFTLLLPSYFFLSSFANAFALSTNPPRFEISGEAGKTIRKTIVITNLSNKKEVLKIKTQDWSFSEKGKLSFFDYLGKDSCRPWVKLERLKMSLGSGKARKFRFEIKVPANAPTRECRFAISIEGTKSFNNKIGNKVSLPVNGSVAVIVYLSINNAKSKLKLTKVKTAVVNKKKVPVAFIKNTGNAHGRMSGQLTGVDAKGVKYFLSISTLPILTGQTRGLVLSPRPQNKSIRKFKVKYPIKIKGRLFTTEGEINFKQTVK